MYVGTHDGCVGETERVRIIGFVSRHKSISLVMCPTKVSLIRFKTKRKEKEKKRRKYFEVLSLHCTSDLEIRSQQL